jgi:Protein of unknown function (DUF2905)
MEHLGRTLILTGGIILLVGVFLTFGPRLPFRIGRLPLDFHYEGNNFGVYFPLGTSIVISIILTIIVRLLTKR